MPKVPKSSQRKSATPRKKASTRKPRAKSAAPKKHASPAARGRGGLLLRFCMAMAVVLLVLVAWSDARIQRAFAGKMHDQPAKVFARPLILASGVAFSAAELNRELVALGYRLDARMRRSGTYQQNGNDFLIWLREFRFADGHRQSRKVRVILNYGSVREVRAEDGEVLPEILLEPKVIGGIYPGRNEDRLLTSLEDTPRMLVETLLHIEDRNFYKHFGLSPRGIARAAMTNLRAGRTVQGGSTLTQQLVKNTVLSRERSFYRKFLEAIMAPLVELRYTKDEILELYLNEVYLGQEGSRAIHGFGLAAVHYFNRPLTELSMEQMAMLVGLVKGPSYYDPWRHPERARERRNVVLAAIAAEGWLNNAQLRQAEATPLRLAKASAIEGVYPAYIDLVRRQLSRDYRAEDLNTQGLRIFTPFDPLLQGMAEKSVTESLKKLGKDFSEVQIGMVVTTVNSGDVVAVVGGREPRFAGFNRALDAVRPVGSLIKPAVYLAALRQPQRYSLVTKIEDAEIELQNVDGSFWKPRNYDRKLHGEVMLHEALANSYNLATIRLGLDVGLEPVLQTLFDLGVGRRLQPLPSLLLGSAELAPIEVAAMYQTIAAGGLRSGLRSIYAVTDSKGELVAHYPQKPMQTVSAAAIHLLQYALQEVVREGTGRGVYERLRQDYRVAGKTGTTNELKDSWFAGFAGDYVSVVWMGRDDNQPAGLTGSRGAMMVWREFMAAASHEQMPFVKERDITYEWVDAESGFLTRSGCANARYMPFITGHEPRISSDCGAGGQTIFDWFRRALD